MAWLQPNYKGTNNKWIVSKSKNYYFTSSLDCKIQEVNFILIESYSILRVKGIFIFGHDMYFWFIVFSFDFIMLMGFIRVCVCVYILIHYIFFWFYYVNGLYFCVSVCVWVCVLGKLDVVLSSFYILFIFQQFCIKFQPILDLIFHILFS